MFLFGATIQAPFLSSPVLAQSVQIMKLPTHQGVHARDMPLSAISATNTEMKHMQSEQQPTPKSKRELYAKFTEEQG